MNGSRAVSDSNVIIFASKQKIDITRILSNFDEFYVSVITYMEVYAYDFENVGEKILIDQLFDLLIITEINRPIADQSIIYRKKKAKKIKLPDAIVLATAHYLNATLITDDWDDFKGIDDNIKVLGIDNAKI
jgi:predicted nucleic acid-binding protein